MVSEKMRIKEIVDDDDEDDDADDDADGCRIKPIALGLSAGGLKSYLRLLFCRPNFNLMNDSITLK